MDNGFGVVSQESWIQHGTIRSNILFGLPYNAELYEEVVNACALNPDFVLAHNGDLTEVSISERTVIISNFNSREGLMLFILGSSVVYIFVSTGRREWNQSQRGSESAD